MIDPENYRCPCCTNFIYDDYKCDNDHHLCGNCFMKVKSCPLCRNENIKKSKIINNIETKECKNKSLGCNLSVYTFDNEHELDCLYNELNCRFCNNSIQNADFDSIIEHYKSNCTNIFNYIKYENENKTNYDIQIKSELTLLNIDDQYIVIVNPKATRVNFIVFSTNIKYKLSNYKIKINGSFETFIHYKKMYDFYIQREDINLNKFSIKNMFTINKQTKSYKHNNVHYFESSYVEGEPDSPGNWTKESYDEMYDKFSNLFKK